MVRILPFVDFSDSLKLKKLIRPKTFIYPLCLCCLFLSNLSQGQIYINEVATTNNTFLDNDGETKDWIELYNSSDQTVSLENWTISDDRANPQKWLFPAIEIPADSFFTFFASGKDRNQILTYQTVLEQGDPCKYVIPNVSTSKDWRLLDFDDNDWKAGQTGIGYGDDDDNTIVPERTRSVFLRQTFNIDNPTDIQEIILHVDYDDGFIAYLNGEEIARSNMEPGEFPPYYAGVLEDREAKLYDGGDLAKFVVNEAVDTLVKGENVLAIQVHNINTNSSDLSIIPFLTLGTIEPIDAEVADLIDLTLSFLHTNFKLSQEETVYLYNHVGELQDSLYLPLVPSNITIGRFPDGATNSLFFEEPTPNGANSMINFAGFIEEEVLFSLQSGIYKGEKIISLSSVNENGVIRYTTDGTNPDIDSKIYDKPITINSNRTLKAAIFQDNYLPSQISTATYLMNVEHDLPVLALAFDNADFFDENTGIYTYGTAYNDDLPYFGANFWEDLEKPVYIFFFENEEIAFETGVGAKIFGGWSRANDQRSLSLFFRSEYGYNALKYPLFPDREYDKYEALVLRNSGNDWQRTMLRDLTLTGLMQNSNVDIQAGRPIVAYLNGRYWGIYNAREKVNEHFLSSLHNVSTNGMSILEKDGEVIYGDNKAYKDLIKFVSDNNLSDNQNYEQVAEQIDLANFIQYYAAQIYFDNTDWPGNNIKFWKAKNGKWRWILFDTDFGFGIWDVNRHNNNTLAFALNPSGPNWPNPPWSTLLFRKLMENETFKKRFINTFADELNTRFLAEKVRSAIDANREKMRNEMPAHIQKWGKTSMTAWNSKVNDMKTFAGQRPLTARNFIKNQFGLPTQRLIRLAIDNTDGGSVQLNTIRINEKEWAGHYFPTVPITLTAVAKTDYTFSHWSGTTETTDKTITLDPNRTINVKANFVRKDGNVAASDVVFNEINYNSPKDIEIGDWVELYNNGGEQDLSDWTFKDDDDEHIFKFPVGTILGANEYLVLAKDTEKFATRFPNVINKIGDFDFGLSSKGEFIRLYDDANNLVDSVYYLPDNGWPESANGEGPSLELIDPNSDNTLPENWITYTSNGTPGRANGVYTSTLNESVLADFIKVSPNPFQEQITVSVDLPESSDLQIDLLSINGQIINQLVQQKNVQKEVFELEMPTVTAGNYLVRIVIDGEQVVKKVVKL